MKSRWKWHKNSDKLLQCQICHEPFGQDRSVFGIHETKSKGTWICKEFTGFHKACLQDALDSAPIVWDEQKSEWERRRELIMTGGRSD